MDLLVCLCVFILEFLIYIALGRLGFGVLLHSIRIIFSSFSSTLYKEIQNSIKHSLPSPSSEALLSYTGNRNTKL